MAKEINLKELSNAELIELSAEYKEQGRQIKKKRMAIQAEFTERGVEEETQRVMAQLSDPAKARLAQVIQAQGIESAAAVGTPGAR